MADAVVSPRRRGWLRILGWVLLILILLVVILFFVVTSSAFLKGVVLPKVSKSIHATVTVGDASIHPFSRVILRQVKVQTTGSEPLFQADEVRLVYHLGDILAGNYHVEEVTVTSPTIEFITNPDGSKNTDPLFQQNQAKSVPPAQPARPSQPSKPQKVTINKVVLNNATVRLITDYRGGGRDVTVMTNINIALDNVRNGQTGKLTLGANLALDNHPPAPGTNASLQGTIGGNFTFNLAADLKPDVVNGNTRVVIQNAGGGMSDLAGMEANLDCDITPTDIRQAVLRFQKGGGNLGELRASGPFNVATLEGHVEVVLTPIDRRVLNIVGAQSGIDFGSTTVTSTNHVDLAKAAALVTVIGQAQVNNMSLKRKEEATPALDLHSDYHVIIDLAGKSVLLQSFNLNGTQNRQPLVHASLSSPMSLAWGGISNAIGQSALQLTVTNFNIAEWKPFLGDAASAGNLDFNLNLLSKQGGRLLTIDLVSQIQGLSAGLGSNQIQQADVTMQARGQAEDLKKIDVSEYRLQAAQQGQPMLTVSGSGQYDLKATNADLQLTLEAACARLFQAMGQPDVNASSGTVTFKGHVVRKPRSATVTGNLMLADLTGRYKKYAFDNFGATADLNIAQSIGQLQINKIAGTLAENGHAGGRFEISGNYDPDKKTGQLTINLVDLNENGLRPFVASALGSSRVDLQACKLEYSIVSPK